MKTFDKLENRYIFKGTLILSEAMHIGSGEGNERTDSTFVKNNNKFYIPGSSLRGALRSAVERIVSTLGGNTCMLSENSGECISVNHTNIQAFQKLVEAKKKEQELIQWLEEKKYLCDTCKLFGSTHFASKIKISDLHLKEINPQEGIIRYGIGIDRDTGTASDGALFDMEVIEKNTKFDFELIAENLEGNDFGILSIGIQEMLRGDFYIGAKSSIGLGKCKLEITQIQYFDIADPIYNLKKYLTEDKMGTKAVGWINTQIKTLSYFK